MEQGLRPNYPAPQFRLRSMGPYVTFCNDITVQISALPRILLRIRHNRAIEPQNRQLFPPNDRFFTNFGHAVRYSHRFTEEWGSGPPCRLLNSLKRRSLKMCFADLEHSTMRRYI